MDPSLSYESHEQRFYDNVKDLSELIYELISLCYDNGYKHVHPELVKLASQVLSNFDKQRIIENFIQYSKPYWDNIIDRDEQFFILHASKVFSDLPLDNVDAFKILFTSTDKSGHLIINNDDKQAIWLFFDSLIKIVIKYIHEKRGPKLKESDEGLKPIYSIKYHHDIKLQKFARHYKIELSWPQSI